MNFDNFCIQKANLINRFFVDLNKKGKIKIKIKKV